jgi:hypothetical protein
MANDPTYNCVYKALVEGPNDVSGALAYVLYKNEKIAYIESFATENGQQPKDVDLVELHRMTNLPGRLESYREQADVLLEEFLDNALTEQFREYKQQLRDDAILKQIKPSFMHGVYQNILAGLITTLMTFGFVLVVWMYNEGPSKILAGAASKFMNGETQAPQAQPILSTK